MSYRALYYPYIHFRDLNWLKAATLYWDQIGRIIPTFDYELHDNPDVESLRAKDIVTEFLPGGAEIEVGAPFQALIADHKARLQAASSIDQVQDWDVDEYTLLAAPRDVEPRFAYLHRDKLDSDLVHLLHSSGLATDREQHQEQWLGMHPRLVQVYMTALAESMRRLRECAGLRVGRIDVERATITVAEQITRGAGGRSVPSPPKSAAGRRTMAVPAALMEVLAAHLTRRGLTARDTDAFVFSAPDSEHLDYSNWLQRIWYPARAKAELEWLQFHDLRRANATGLVLEGVDMKTAQARLGHTDPRLTLAIYAQATTEADREAAERLGKRFLRPQHGDTGRRLA